MTFLSRFSRLVFNISPEVVQQVDISISKNADALYIPAFHHRNRQRLDFDKAIDEYSCKGNHQKSEHVFKTFYSKMGFLHVESGGLQRSECGLESPTLAIGCFRIVALQWRCEDYKRLLSISARAACGIDPYPRVPAHQPDVMQYDGFTEFQR